MFMSAVQLLPDTIDGAAMFRYFALALAYVLRLFYDCLVHWTGAGPAEFYSYQSVAVTESTSSLRDAFGRCPCRRGLSYVTTGKKGGRLRTCRPLNGG